MDKKQIEDWLVSSKVATINSFGLKPNWWPITNLNNQSFASAWASAFFTEAALQESAGAHLVCHCSNGIANANQKMINAKWLSSAGTTRTHSSDQLMLDYAVVNRDAASPIQITGESEMGAQHPTAPDPTPVNGYAWDFYKLLLVPSATRMFMARVAADKGATAPQRVVELANSLRSLVDRYGPTFVRPNDEIGAAIIPTTTKTRDETIILWVKNARVRFEKITPKIL